MSSLYFLPLALAFTFISLVRAGGSEEVEPMHCDTCFHDSVVENCHTILEKCKDPNYDPDFDKESVAPFYVPLMDINTLKSQDIKCIGLYSLFVTEKLFVCELKFSEDNPLRKDLVLGGFSFAMREGLEQKFGHTECDGWEILKNKTLDKSLDLSDVTRTVSINDARDDDSADDAHHAEVSFKKLSRSVRMVRRNYIGESTFDNKKIGDLRAIRQVAKKHWKKDKFSFRKYFDKPKRKNFIVRRTYVDGKVKIKVAFNVRDFDFEGVR